MPRKPSFYSIVRAIRTELGWTQAQLAKRLGVTVITVNRIENRSLSISRRIATRLASMTGVLFADIMANRSGPLRIRYAPDPGDVSGGLFSAESLKQKDQRARNLSDDELVTLSKNHQYRSELLLKAALKECPHKLWVIDSAVERAYDELEKEFGLIKAVKEVRESAHDPEMVKWMEENLPAPPRAEAQSANKPAPQPL